MGRWEGGWGKLSPIQGCLSWRRSKEHPQPCPQHPVWCRVNVGCGPAEQRLLLTGLHSVADIFCESCKTTLGWKYVSAPGTPNLGVGITLAPQPFGLGIPKT